MNPIPNEMRKRILDDCNNGMSEVAAAEKWGVSPSLITKLKRHVRETGSIDPENAEPNRNLNPVTIASKKLSPTRPMPRCLKFANNCRSRCRIKQSPTN